MFRSKDTLKRGLAEKQTHELKTIDTPTVSNAIEKCHLRSLVEGFMGMDIRCFFPELGTMVGHALTLTVDTTTAEKQKKFGLPEMLQAILETPKPVILVIKAVGPRPEHTCVFGDLMARVAKHMGAVGLVTDGGVRDIKNIRKIGFHLFARGAVPSHGNFSIEQINASINLSGVEIQPGDLIHGDENGVLKVPWDCVDKLSEVAKKLLAQENRIVNFVKSSHFSIEKLKEISQEDDSIY
ncbi:RraA family protein [Candidatus Aerophobetes bacterium]|nr:RraA family protein [Candidatus Aerophobetes bacterium]